MTVPKQPASEGIFEVREYINGRTDWYSHWFANARDARAWIEEREDDLVFGADIVFRRFDSEQELRPVYILDPLPTHAQGCAS